MDAILNSGEIEYMVTTGFTLRYEEKDDLILPAYKGNLNLQYASMYVEPPLEPEPPVEETSPETELEQTTSPETEPAPDESVTTDVYTEQEPPATDETDSEEVAQ